MKTVLVISDTHGNYELLQHVLDSNIFADIIIHLGDDYDDLDSCVYNRRGRKVYRVPGLFHPEYKNGKLPRVLEIKIKNIKFLIAHSPEDIRGKGDLILYGHTHNWEICNSIAGTCFNPGHLRDRIDKGRIATYGIIEVRDNKMTLRVFYLQHNVIAEANIEKL